jgi:hypothetical protein
MASWCVARGQWDGYATWPWNPLKSSTMTKVATSILNLWWAHNPGAIQGCTIIVTIYIHKFRIFFNYHITFLISPTWIESYVRILGGLQWSWKIYLWCKHNFWTFSLDPLNLSKWWLLNNKLRLHGRLRRNRCNETY